MSHPVRPMDLRPFVRPIVRNMLTQNPFIILSIILNLALDKCEQMAQEYFLK